MRIGIVGAGMAGLACAEGLADAGHDVVLWAKGRAPGGLMSTRRVPTSVGEAHFDFGAQFFSVRDPAFLVRVDRWITAGLVAPWPPAGSDAHVGVPADPIWITETLVAALAELLGSRLPPVVSASSHRWRFARSGSDGGGSMWDIERRLGVCGDWLIGPRVEAAWISGTALAGKIAESVP